LLLTAALFILAVYGVLQANQDLLSVGFKRYFVFKILDPSSASGLFVSAVGVLILRHQYGVSSRPRINYKTSVTTKTDTNNPAMPYEIWRVEIRNNGLGAAIINRAEYVLELAKADGSVYIGGYNQVLKELAKIDLVLDRDYSLENITTGFALPDKDSLLIFEIKKEHISKIKRLDITIYFQGQVGDKYCRGIFCIPHGQTEFRQKLA